MGAKDSSNFQFLVKCDVYQVKHRPTPRRSIPNLFVLLHFFTVSFIHPFVFQEAIMSVLDHKNIDQDVPYFKDVVRYLNCIRLLACTFQTQREEKGEL